MQMDKVFKAWKQIKLGENHSNDAFLKKYYNKEKTIFRKN